MIKEENSSESMEKFYRTEYGKMVSVITKYLGTANVQTAEDIVQETLLKAVENWQQKGMPQNPQAWLYTTAKNLAFNHLKRQKLKLKFEGQLMEPNPLQMEKLDFHEGDIADEQLKMMFVCCHPSISESLQIPLILKILCGFSISEIANAFFASTETINKRLVRGRKQLRAKNISFEFPKNINDRLPIVLKTIFLLFNEGYCPTLRNEPIRFDLCIEAIRLCEILTTSEAIVKKGDCHALLGLMNLNAARFDSRTSRANTNIEMVEQNRKDWNQKLINEGIYHLNIAQEENHVSVYLILGAISANHCTAPSFEKTDWAEILSLYDILIKMQDTPIIRLNRAVALSKAQGNKQAILELEKLENIPAIGNNHFFHSTIAELYKLEKEMDRAKKSYQKAISSAKNERDLKFLQKKLMEVVLISQSQLL